MELLKVASCDWNMLSVSFQFCCRQSLVYSLGLMPSYTVSYTVCMEDVGGLLFENGVSSIQCFEVFGGCLVLSRMRCRKEGGIRFAIDGSGVFISVLVSNVAGAGDVVGLKVKGSQTGWLPMSRNWGQNWILNANLKNQPLSFEVTTSDGAILMSYNVAPKSWKIGQTFDGKQFD